MQKYAAPAAVGVALVLVAVLAFWPTSTPDGHDEPSESDGHEESSRGSATPSTGGDGEQVELTMHVMSQCPYGVKVVQAITPVAKGLGNRFKLNLEYIGREEDGELSSMHGQSEMDGNKLQLCAHAHGSYNAWIDFMACQNENWRQIPEGWERCARSAELDVDEITSCFEGDEGTRLLRASFRASKKAGARGSPTMYLNGEQYRGGRTEQAFGRAVCAVFGDEAPNYCSEIPAPPAVPVTILADARCERPECNVKGRVRSLKTRIPGAKITEVDFESARGRELFEEASLKMLPAILIGREIQQDREAFKGMRNLKRQGDMYIEQVGRFDPVKGEWLERPEVPLRFLVDERCKSRECESLPRFESFIKRQVPNVKVSQIEYTSDEGRALYAQLVKAWADSPPEPGPRGRTQPLGLPMAFFGKSIEAEDEAFSRLERRFRKLDDQYLFQLGAWDPTAEICDNETDDDGDRQVDCSDSDCEGQIVCRDEEPRKMQAFVMSQCPYGVRVLDAMREVIENFGRDQNKIAFRMEFIGDVGEDGSLSSMHGQPEVDENLREICAQHHYAKNYRFMDYVWCRNKNIRSAEWEECATDGIDAAVIRECSEGDEGQQLLRTSYELAKTLGMRGSPSWLLNNRYEMNGRTPDDIKSAFCERNEQPECSNTLTKEAPNPQKRGGGGGSCG